MASKTDVVVKLVLVFFISLLSFSIGTFVGKKYSDNQHKLASLEPQSATQREVASEKGHGPEAAPGSEHKDGALTDEDIKKLAEEFVADDTEEVAQNPNGGGESQSKDSHTAPTAEVKNETAKATDSAKKPEPAGHAAPSVAAVTAGAHDLIDGKKPAPAATEVKTRQPSSIPKDVAQYSVGKFTVQIAAYETEDEARKKSNELKEKGYSAFYIPAQVKGRNWYRVSVGLFATEDEAKKYREDFRVKTKVETTLIQKIVN